MPLSWNLVGGKEVDGIPVASFVRTLTLPRLGGAMGGPLPMVEVRQDGDAGGVAARWPEPFETHDLGEG